MNTLKRTLLASALASLSLPVMADSAHPKIGFSIDDLRLERWSRDRDYFVAAAEKLDAKVFVQSADANEQKQISQIENLIARGVDVIVIVPFNATVLTNAVAEAKKAGIKVVSYDRLILNADIDAYISFDNEKVGEMQANGVLKAAPKGNYFLLGGAPTDNNAKILREGQMKALQPAIDRGDIKIVGQQWVKEWNPTEALSIVENALSVITTRSMASSPPTTPLPAARSRPSPHSSWPAKSLSRARMRTSRRSNGSSMALRP